MRIDESIEANFRRSERIKRGIQRQVRLRREGVALDALARDVGDEGLNRLLAQGVSGVAFEAAHAACEEDPERWDLCS